MIELIYKEESYKIIGACFEVYKEMGCGFLEPVYQECLEKELTLQGIPFDAQKIVALNYKGQKLDKVYKPDFFCYDKIIVEIKAVSKLNNEFRAQIINYLNATNMRLGLLINFGHFPKIEHERFVL
ncbi:MAG: GxxExxY protein [Candidatus Marinimicrobia bacterium]|jgi:GxxExxY protein|nr:GxxExxY protein [Candidatus Neomarinimicrobiota bacterium]